MKFNELDFNKKCRRTTWDKGTYITIHDNNHVSLFYKNISGGETRAIFILSKSDLETNDWEYLEEKKYQVLYKYKKINKGTISASEFLYPTIENFYEKSLICKEQVEWIYLIDENGERVK